ncbi:hypothetical protein [Streptomyces lichenis]|uniref:Ig-like domain-containing protein n=1 Tax=Streptomyces lichenis TaxID=2306967 RepID=A0ABT0IB12_9ACTN|nr:hypothetical protein [Streptomyces lichenis]MCK8678515.1 hypothetical protein [Streptomyces lichenis]
MSPSTYRAVAALTCMAAAALAMATPAASAAPATEQGVKSIQLQWASASPADPPHLNGYLTIGGTYTCTEPTGTTVDVSFTAMQILPLAMPSGVGSLPCGPGVVDANWEVTSLASADVHRGWTNVFLTFDGQTSLPQQLDAA